MNDMVVGCITGYHFAQIEPWVVSLERSGFSGRKMMIVYNVGVEIVTELQRRGFAVTHFARTSDGYHYKDRFNICIDRFLHLWQLLSHPKDAADVRYVITTDVKDVVFQTDPAQWLERHLGDRMINVGSESLRYRDEPWGYRNMLESFGPVLQEHAAPNIIYNAGTIGGTGAALRDLALNIYLMCQGAPMHVKGGGGPDQAALNILLSLEPYRSMTRFNASEDGWACQAGTVADPKKIRAFRANLLDPEPVFRDGQVFTHGGERFCMVHQYDRIPAWKGIIDAMYRD